MSYCFKLIYKLSERNQDSVKRYKIKFKGINDNNNERNKFTRIFGNDFVKRNKNKFRIIYNNKEYPLKEFFEEIDNNYKPWIKIKFKLRIFHNILNLSGMFFNCYGLLAMKDDAKVNKEQVKAKLKYGLSISKKEEKKPFKIIDINRMFYGCKSLVSIPDISDWNMENVTNLFGLFYECESLISIPDISKWNMKN